MLWMIYQYSLQKMLLCWSCGLGAIWSGPIAATTTPGDWPTGYSNNPQYRRCTIQELAVAAAMIVMVVMIREITCSPLWLEGTLYPTTLPFLPPSLKRKKGPSPGLLRYAIVPVEAVSCP